ncbi:MAG: phosphate propanoyltransferase [Clostridioides sp.]|jgi:propanediol utilization protein|nr:phosphate propanoyltransferase [Clostridioides sp.]
MENYEAVMKLLLEAVKSGDVKVDKASTGEIPVGISNRHVHLSQGHVDTLFGPGYQLTKLKDLSQPGQYACKETITICGPKGAIEKVRVLGPVRNETQVEVSGGDCIKLGVKSNVRLSGDLSGTPAITVVGPKGSVIANEGLIVAQRHIHMTPEDAKQLDLANGELVEIKTAGLRGGTYNSVSIRVDESYSLECHLDVEEANAMGITPNTKIQICR